MNTIKNNRKPIMTTTTATFDHNHPTFDEAQAWKALLPSSTRFANCPCAMLFARDPKRGERMSCRP